MSLELYSLIPGQQVKRDRDLSNVTIQCDPLAVYPDNRTAAGVATAGNRFKPGEAGKLAVEDEICDLTINGNLEVKGKLKVSAFPAEICNIFCPEDFNLRAGNDIALEANTGSVHVQTIDLTAGIASDSGFKLLRGTKFFSQNVGTPHAVHFAGCWAAGVGNIIKPGSTDVCGFIEVGGTAGAATDRVGLTFAVPYNGPGFPTVTLTISDASAAANVAITITAQSATGFTCTIPTGANIPADSLIQYQVIALA